MRTRKISEHNVPAELLDNLPPRTRKLTDTSSVTSEKPAKTPTVYNQRRADHLKKFKEIEGIPERKKLTMFDLIYYNPSDGNKMSNPSSLRSSRAPSPEKDDAQCNIFLKLFPQNNSFEKLKIY